MTAVGPEDEILDAQRKAHSHGRGFLPQGQVRRSLVLHRQAFVGPLGLDLVQGGLELPDQRHVFVDREQPCLAVLLGFLGRDWLLLPATTQVLEVPQLTWA